MLPGGRGGDWQEVREGVGVGPGAGELDQGKPGPWRWPLGGSAEPGPGLLCLSFPALAAGKRGCWVEEKTGTLHSRPQQ